ncbi:type II toxin-antitoxin system PemK/MazF family toxin [Actinobacillus vicugnae]|uniref:type II toxin-antitoxin system PemK/MazF family toxin n=1 Tax=Actinobacillus vicugnae TaxID=2573093 RepID=UPI001241937F|nr:type II toxin-antitoxin system PemK/MazF family toxin [Actinobacillus vicugnae]
MYTPNRGDIIHLPFDPASGQEMKGDHFALVVSSKLFNERGLAFVCPISQGAANYTRSFGTVVSLMGSGTHTQGAIHCHQLKSLDWRVRHAKRKETVPDFILEDVLLRIEAILSE